MNDLLRGILYAFVIELILVGVCVLIYFVVRS